MAGVGFLLAGFANVTEYVEALTDGRTKFTAYRKLPNQVTVSGVWFDFSLSPGNPRPQYYAATPLVAQAMYRSVQGGFEHGNAVSPAIKFVHRLGFLPGSPVYHGAVFYLLDYLLYYPFIDESDTDAQVMDNTTPLPRYTDGDGVMMMAVSVGAHIGGSTFSVNYTNSDGVAGRTSATVTITTIQVVNGTIIHSAPTATGRGPFIPLQAGDKGVQSVQSVTMDGVGDVGLFALVLVKPITNLHVPRFDAPAEVDSLKDHAKLPVVQDDAYLNLIGHGVGSSSGIVFHAYAEFVWG